MLYYLFRFLSEYHLPGAHLWSYISFRALLTLILSLTISIWFGQYFIKWMHRHNINETQRDPSIDPYGIQKKDVPTMGGVIITAAIIIPTLLLARLRNIYIILMLTTTLWLAFIGFLDDYIKLKRNKNGLSPTYKLIAQALLGLLVGLTLSLSPDAVIHENITTAHADTTEHVTHKSKAVKSTITTIPFLKSHNLDYSRPMAFLGKYKTVGGWVIYIAMVTFVVMAVSNGANLNDGMDGMTAGNAAIIGVALGILAYVSSHISFASYLNIMFIPGSEELVIYLCAFVGALVGFLWYNAYPAQIFMGDTGSLTIGGIIAVTAVIIRKELLLPLLCFIFLLESISVILQVHYAKWGNKRGLKLRVFKRAPLHDAFRVLPQQLSPDLHILFNRPKGYWLESKVTVRFWIVTIILASLALITLKIR